MTDIVKEIIPCDHKVSGVVSLPGSKSMTHRAMLMAALADGPSTILNPLRSEDTLYTAQALEQLGCKLEWILEKEEIKLRISPLPVNERKSNAELVRLFVGNSGTTMRLLLGFLGAVRGCFVLDGSARMRERPVGPVAESMSQLGVRCRFLEKDGYPPVEVFSQGLNGGHVLVDARKSSQFLSAVLIAAPRASSDVIVKWLEPVASFPYVVMTLRMMKERGIEIRELSYNELLIPAPQTYTAGTFTVEGDCSSASYFWATAALTGGEVRTEPVFRESYQGDAEFLKVLSAMGCSIVRDERSVTVVGPEELLAVDVDMNAMPDMVPTLAVLAAFASGKTVIRRVGHLRIKESDRLRAVASELGKLGVRVEEGEDFLVIYGGTAKKGADIETYDDHRVAMAFSLAGLKIPGVRIKNPDVVKKSFPEYWFVWERFVYGF
ncbi:MAG: 3-phosphoshikimate 1-carboxyvinyltransferase [Thermodesulforhabdaceae bacterium]